ncbi:ImcF-related family protein [Moellerella wisconsensis]
MKKVILLSLLFIALLALNLLGWFFLSDSNIYIIMNTIFSVLIVIFLGYLLSKIKFPPRKIKEHIVFNKIINVAFKELFKNNIFQSNSHYSKAVFLLTGESKSGKTQYLIDNGFKLIKSICNESISLWSSSTMIIIEVEEVSHARTFNQIVTILLRYRPRKALDGIIFITSCNYLLSLNQNERITLGESRFKLINNINILSGLKLSVTLLHSHLDTLTDFYSYITSNENDKNLGLLAWEINNNDSCFFNRDYEENIKSILFNIVNQQYQRLDMQNNSIGIVSFPYQFQMLLLLLKDYFQSIQGNKNQNFYISLNYISFYCQKLTNPKYDLLSKSANEIYDGVIYNNNTNILLERSFFMTGILEHIIIKSKQQSSLNNYQNIKYYISNSLIIIFMILGMTLFGRQLHNNWEINDRWIAQVSDELDYFNRAFHPHLSINHKIKLLNSIQNLVTLSERKLAWYHYISFNQSNINQELVKFNQQKIAEILLPILEGILKKIMIDSSTSDEANLYQAIYHYKMLYDKTLFNPQSLSFHISNNADFSDSESLTELIQLIETMPIRVIEKNSSQIPFDLIKSYESMIDSTQLDNILYQRIKQRPEFNQQILLSQIIGPNIDRVFLLADTALNKSTIPFIFTKEGYQAIDLSSNSSLLREEMINMKKMRGGSTEVNLLELAKMSRRINTLYLSEYIKVWKQLISALKIKPIISQRQLAETMSLLSDPDNNVLVDMLQFISTNTLLNEDNTPNIADGKSVSTQLGLTKTTKLLKKAQRVEGAMGNKLRELQPGYRVNKSFQTYHELINASENGELPINELLNQFHRLSTLWEYDTAQATGDDFFYQIAVGHINKTDDMLSGLNTTIKKYPDPLQQWTNQLVNYNWQFILNATAHYLDSRWKNDVYPEYQHKILGRFPFSDSPRDVSLTALNDFFQAQGVLNEFMTLLSPFITYSKKMIVLRVNDGQNLALSSYFMSQLNTAKKVQSIFFISEDNTQAQVNISIKPIMLTPSLTEIQLYDSKLRFRYRHGPRFWDIISWPEIGLDGDLYLGFYKDSLQLYANNYQGQWGVFRLLFNNEKNTNEGEFPRIDYKIDKYQFLFEYQINNQSIVISQQLFEQLSLPMTILANDK